jgi:CheY-like chemotaxis protein
MPDHSFEDRHEARPYRVLLAEDNPSNAFLADVALRHFKCDVRVVHDGAAAVAAAAEQPFDVIFMDYHMPVMNGLEATNEIRSQESQQQRARTPIVAITASAMPSERAMCLSAGMDDVLVKPFVLKELAEMLARWAGQR